MKLNRDLPTILLVHRPLGTLHLISLLWAGPSQFGAIPKATSQDSAEGAVIRASQMKV